MTTELVTISGLCHFDQREKSFPVTWSFRVQREIFSYVWNFRNHQKDVSHSFDMPGII